MILDVQFEKKNVTFDSQFEGVVKVREDVSPYEGDYEVTPKVNEQVLPTAQKFMTNDVTINGIPIYRVTNNSGGTTIYIAKEI